MAEDNSDSEEEIFIYAEFNESVNIEKYRSIHVLGINEKNPIIQADDSFFSGKFQHPLGTYMFFENDPAPQSADPLFDKLPEKNLKYVCKANKMLVMEHAYVLPREGKEHFVKSETDCPKDEIKPVKFNTIEEALEKIDSLLAPKAESNSTSIANSDSQKPEKGPEEPMDTS